MDRNLLRRLTATGGFTLLDTMVTITVFAVLAAMAVPLMTNLTDGIKLGQGAREVERELQTARLKAVTANRTMRIRFNCPVAGEYRMVELIGTPSVPAAADSDGNRCNELFYPYPAGDNEPVTVPNHDGPQRRLDPALRFDASVTSLEFLPDGSARMSNGAAGNWPVIPTTPPAKVILWKGDQSKTIEVNGLGKIQIQ